MIPYGHQSIDQDDVDEVIRVLQSDWLTQGPKVLEFEKSLAQYCGAKYAVAVASGTAALHLAYMAADLKKNNEVITTPNTFVATSNMMLAVGALPVFCDIRNDTYNIDEEKIESLISEKTKAIVPVHFAGHACAMEKINAIAKKYNLLVIEDACHALGAKYKDRKIGDCQYSDMVVFSFHPVKAITTGEGGAILTNNEDYYKKILMLRSHGIEKDKNNFNVMTSLGHNYRITDIQAALGVSQLKKLDKFISKRHQVVKWYEEQLGDMEEIILPVELNGCYCGWHIYVIRVKEFQHRLPLYRHLLANEIGVNFHYPAVYGHPYYRDHGFGDKKCVNADNFEQSAITLPLHTLLSREDVIYIADNIKKYFLTVA